MNFSRIILTGLLVIAGGKSLYAAQAGNSPVSTRPITTVRPDITDKKPQEMPSLEETIRLSGSGLGIMAPITPPDQMSPVYQRSLEGTLDPNGFIAEVLPAPGTTRDGPDVTPPPAFPGQVPVLPPARACKAADLAGLWKLLQVYEEPSGTETAAFQEAQLQYLRFNADSTYGQYLEPFDKGQHLKLVNQGMVQQATGLQQYVVQPDGKMFFYSDGVAVKSQACFIAEKSQNYYREGQMLLMPPSQDSPTRWVKIYTKLWEEKPPAMKPKKAKPAAQPAAQQ